MKSFVVREATASDAEEVVRLGEYMYASVGASVHDPWRELGRQQVELRLGNDLFGWVVDAARDSSAGEQGVPRPLAACAFANLNARLPLPNAQGPWRAYIQWVCVDPAFQRRGLASALMTALENWAVDRGVDVLELASSPAGRGLYESLGYEASPDVHYPSEVRGVPMRKILAAKNSAH